MKGGEGTVRTRLASTLRQTAIHLATRHVLGFPEPQDSPPVSMPWPRVLVIENGKTVSSSIGWPTRALLLVTPGMLLPMTRRSRLWTRMMDCFSEWKKIPSEVHSKDLVKFVISQAR